MNYVDCVLRNEYNMYILHKNEWVIVIVKSNKSTGVFTININVGSDLSHKVMIV